MDTDLEFLDEVESFLSAESLPRVVTPCKTVQNCQVFTFPSQDIAQHDGKSYSMDKNLLDVSTEEPQRKDDRRKRYRVRVKSEKQELKRMEKDLTRKKQQIIDRREGRDTIARTDVMLSKSFWQDVAIQQRENREQAETEQKRLMDAVQSQASYIENLCAIISERSSTSNAYALENQKWRRLKSSDAYLFEAFIQEADYYYARIDEVFADCGMTSQLMTEIHSVRRTSPDTRIEYAQHVHKIILPFRFEATCKFMWEGTNVPYRQHAREIYSNVEDVVNTRAMKFRLKKALGNSTVSILKRVVARRYLVDKRMVIMFKTFSEGEGIFSGLDTDETVWCSIRPCEDESRGTVMEFCARTLPVLFQSACTTDSTLKEYQGMLEDVSKEDEQELVSSLQRLAINST
ncbi:hypothetical protein PHMEG_00023487 [Phytophthora megakarya]|uniref:M96 mating-specific protein n=1 Tax=Phytophthora megakarya TaxID=4795 RepID=A0A225VHK0_9STRA|nr:hypothetical protein PHMEG_00023487 [Phytophthora megakarya]